MHQCCRRILGDEIYYEKTSYGFISSFSWFPSKFKIAKTKYKYRYANMYTNFWIIYDYIPTNWIKIGRNASIQMVAKIDKQNMSLLERITTSVSIKNKQSAKIHCTLYFTVHWRLQHFYINFKSIKKNKCSCFQTLLHVQFAFVNLN